MGRYSRELAEPFIALAGVSPGMSALDVGCGTGALTRALADLLGPERVSAVDPSEGFVGACRSRVVGAEVLVAGAESLPFADGSFDAVLSQLVVNFVDDPRAAVLEMLRVARLGGVIASCVWDYRAGMTVLRSFWDAAIALGLPQAAAHDQGRTMPFCTPGELLELWHGAGLTRSSRVSCRPMATTPASMICGRLSIMGSPRPACTSPRLGPSERDAFRAEVFRRLGSPQGAFKLSARALWVRGQRWRPHDWPCEIAAPR